MSKYIIVWNENKNEGVLFEENATGIEDVYHAGGGFEINPCSSLADSFRDLYGIDQECHMQKIDIDTTSTTRIEKDGGIK